MGTGEMLGSYLRWTSIPSRRNSNIPSRFMLLKPGKLRQLWATRLVRLNFFISDILHYTANQNLEGIAFFIDFEKAFDCLVWDTSVKL